MRNWFGSKNRLKLVVSMFVPHLNHLKKGLEAMTISEKLHLLRRNAPLADVPSNTSLVKLVNFLRVSTYRRIKYAWADTICINKDSSAELDESIRSMFAWYRDSHICIVYLGQTDHYVDMERDAWFTRGWTLQELLAPKRLAFYSSSWMQITSGDSDKSPVYWARLGDRRQRRGGGEEASGEELLWPHLAKITGIEAEDLHNFQPGLYDVGKRMTWASKRKTTRIEDTAYCLIGMFDVNLSIAYGEKERAFYRLQVEILQNSDDMSLFDWQGEASTYNSMLAASPNYFSNPLGLRMDQSTLTDGESSFMLTNIGIRTSLVIHQIDQYTVRPSWKLPGATAFSILGESSQPGHHVIMILGKAGDHRRQYRRLKLISDKLDLLSYKKVPEVILIK
ncbi:hypothetical protein FRC17_011084 [Serendipita sp. 399]|nr:hypothetical protein FRC17_011084 [Serendipita sp. 399]